MVFEAEAICREVVSLQCDGHVRCCDRPGEAYGSAAECMDVLLLLCVQDLSGQAYDDARIAFAAAEYRTALAAVQQAVLACRPLGREVWTGVLTGTLPDGADCTPSDDGADYSPLLACRPELACALSAEGERRCAPRGGVGDACAEGECQRALFCDHSGSEPRCRDRKRDGASCLSHGECQSGHCAATERCAPPTASSQYCDDLSYP